MKNTWRANNIGKETTKNVQRKIYNRSEILPLLRPWGPEQPQQVREQAQLKAQVQEQAPPELEAEVQQVRRRRNFQRDFTPLNRPRGG